MNTTSSRLASFSIFSPGVLAASTLDRALDLHSMNSANYSPMEQVMGSGKDDGRADCDTTMHTPSSSQTPELSRSESVISPDNSQTSSQSATSNQPSSTIAFPPKPAAIAQFSSNLIPPTPPTMATPPNNSNATSGSAPSPKSSPRMTRPQLTSRLSSRAGGKRHASIGSQREMPFVLPPASTAPTTSVPRVDSPTPSQTTTTTTASAETTVSQGWNARLRDMGLHIPGIGSPKTPRSGSMSSGAASPRSPEEQRAASYFSFRRRNSSTHAVSPGKAGRSSAATPPPPPPPPPPSAPSRAPAPKVPAAPRHTHSPITEESSSQANSPRFRRANLSLDLSTTLTQRGSTASLPLIGHTPVTALIQSNDQKSRRASLMMSPPPAPPPHIHTPPVQPPAYEYPFLPNHAPTKPLEVRVEEVPPAGGPGSEGGSWAITVRLPGFHPDGITIGTRRGRVLVIVADNYNDNDDGAGHFERRISFGYDADMANIRAEFNGDVLRVTVPRRAMFGLSMIS
ncbi:hypothetical protein FRC12_019832 [Ceratobasidium sp. 428]|nr:hypothetical protein FRC12_019832 [Ceratobasidium sp. 428]